MLMKMLTAATVSLALAATPAVAAASQAQGVNAAAKLSVAANDARTGKKSITRTNRATSSGWVLALLLLAGIIAIPVVAEIGGDDEDSASS